MSFSFSIVCTGSDHGVRYPCRRHASCCLFLRHGTFGFPRVLGNLWRRSRRVWRGERDCLRVTSAAGVLWGERDRLRIANVGGELWLFFVVRTFCTHLPCGYLLVRRASSRADTSSHVGYSPSAAWGIGGGRLWSNFSALSFSTGWKVAFMFGARLGFLSAGALGAFIGCRILVLLGLWAPALSLLASLLYVILRLFAPKESVPSGP